MNKYKLIAGIANVGSKLGIKIRFKLLKLIIGAGNERGAASMLSAAFRRSSPKTKSSMLKVFPWWK